MEVLVTPCALVMVIFSIIGMYILYWYYIIYGSAFKEFIVGNAVCVCGIVYFRSIQSYSVCIKSYSDKLEHVKILIMEAIVRKNKDFL